ncbi:MAG TPA: nuclear transport factor 2 family protein [Gammaproteobacteria bacterium]|nr:nuclear transport factor 2 family protein [Gammaproteobacteria bacterium]
MTDRNLVMAAVLMLSLPTAAFAAATPASADNMAAQRTLIHLEHVWVNALERHNVTMLRRILANGFLDTSYKGQLHTKADQLAGRAAPGIASERLSDLKVRVFGTTAIVTGLNTIIGKQHAWTARIRFTDIFLKRGGRWQAVGAQETLVRAPGARRSSD